ncbi:hypothetical protein KBI23_00445 [bacterium]|nr:hypothetical protein [bacterium]MBP9809094.1 hypothetical protein [bacterium]
MKVSLQLEDVRSFWPAQAMGDGIDVSRLLTEVQEFALLTFDRLDSDGNGFISKAELEEAKTKFKLSGRELSYVRFLCTNVSKISAAHDDHDGPSPIGISRKDLVVGISRLDLIKFFGGMSRKK